MRRLRLRPVALLSAAILLAVSATAVIAQDEALGGKLRTGENVTIPAGETVQGDLYVASGAIVIDGTVDGDLVAAGGDIQVNGTVSGDLIAAGGTVTVAGTVEGDARIAGGQLTVSGDVGEDLLLAGGQATITASGSVGEDVIASAGQLSIAGSVAGSVEGGAGTYDRTGSVGGSENVAVGERGDDTEADRDDANLILDAVKHFIVVVLIGALALWLLPGLTRASAEAIRRRPLASFGSGLLAALGWLLGFIGIVVVIILAAILFGLIGFGELAGLIFIAGIVTIIVATFALFVICGYLADALVGLALAGLVRREPGSRWLDLGLLAAGAAVVVLLTSLPVAGGWIKLVVAILGLGGLALAAWTASRTRRAPTVVVAPPPAEPVP
jgi:cytoskeletal protein CcmA (bactofilin family)